MTFENPDLAWYSDLGSEGAPKRCPFASIHQCPGYYYSIWLFGECGVSSKMSKEEQEKLGEAWDASTLKPAIAEQHPSAIGGGNCFTGICPEVSFDIFHLFATRLFDYYDGMERSAAYKNLETRGVPSTSWQWEWRTITPLHYSDCTYFSKLEANPISNILEQNSGLTSSLSTPETVTLRWLFDHVPLKIWSILLGAVLTAFTLGATFKSFELLKLFNLESSGSHTVESKALPPE